MAVAVRARRNDVFEEASRGNYSRRRTTPQLQLVSSEDTRARSKHTYGACFAAVVLFSVLLLQVGTRLLVLEEGYEMESLRVSLLKGDRELRELELHHAYLISPERLLETASRELGLAETKPQQLRRVALL